MTTQNHHYTTTDTIQATYLIIAGFPILSIDYSKPRYEFVFPQDAESKIQEEAMRYITGKALVDPAAFMRVNRKLVRLVKSSIQWEDE